MTDDQPAIVPGTDPFAVEEDTPQEQAKLASMGEESPLAKAIKERRAKKPKPPPSARALLESLLEMSSSTLTFDEAFAILSRLGEEAEVATAFERTFATRVHDGAYAASKVIEREYGASFGALTDMGMFGIRPAETINVNIAPGVNVQVPFGKIQLPAFKDMDIHLHVGSHPEYGQVFAIHAVGPRRFKDDMERMFDMIDEEIKAHSIYKGQAVFGTTNPEFLDLAGFDSSKVIFTEEVQATLDGVLFAPLRHAEAMRAEGLPVKRSVLLHGPYGTGKTSTGQLVAEVATQNGWTFISARAGRDRVDETLRTARLYQPAVVFLEDIDTTASSGDDNDVTRLLDVFDGITAKGGELMIVMTTNHPERIHRGMMRPGRLDAIVEVAALDRPGIERLVRALVPDEKLAEGVDFDKVALAMEGYYPAFIREATNRAMTFAINRLDGARDYVIDTPDLVGAARSLAPQLLALNGAGEGVKRPELEAVLTRLISKALSGHQIQNPNSDYIDIEQPIKIIAIAEEDQP